MNFKLVKQYLEDHTYPSYRYAQLTAAIVRGANSWQSVTGWPTSLINGLTQTASFCTFTDSVELTAADGTKKVVLTLSDGAKIETVLMQPKPGIFSVCVSSEVGCAMNCAFCATGKMGFTRPLTDEEITDQWLYWQKYHPSHLVFMGMGEPFHNQANVFAAIATLHNEYRLGSRKMSLSTCGLVPGILALAETFPQINLAISLHAASDDLRQRLMPISRRYNLSALQTALNAYYKQTKRQVMFEYLLLKGVNDQPEHFQALITWLSLFPKPLVHLNLIRYNPTDTPFEAPSKDLIYTWKAKLALMGISVSIRKNLGDDIHGACGQLCLNLR